MGLIPAIVASMEKKGAGSALLVALYSRIYNEVIRNEIALAGISTADRVLNVGCGGIPFTAIQVARLTGAKVCAIDRDGDAVQVAKRCIASMKLDEQISIVKSDGTDSLPSDFDVAIVALQAEPKKELLKNLIYYGGPSARLVFRCPRQELSHQYDLLPIDPAPCGKVIQNQVTFDCSVMYQNNEANGIKKQIV